MRIAFLLFIIVVFLWGFWWIAGDFIKSTFYPQKDAEDFINEAKRRQAEEELYKKTLETAKAQIDREHELLNKNSENK